MITKNTKKLILLCLTFGILQTSPMMQRFSTKNSGVSQKLKNQKQNKKNNKKTTNSTNTKKNNAKKNITSGIVLLVLYTSAYASTNELNKNVADLKNKITPVIKKNCNNSINKDISYKIYFIANEGSQYLTNLEFPPITKSAQNKLKNKIIKNCKEVIASEDFKEELLSYIDKNIYPYNQLKNNIVCCVAILTVAGTTMVKPSKAILGASAIVPIASMIVTIPTNIFLKKIEEYPNSNEILTDIIQLSVYDALIISKKMFKDRGGKIYKGIHPEHPELRSSESNELYLKFIQPHIKKYEDAGIQHANYIFDNFFAPRFLPKLKKVESNIALDLLGKNNIQQEENSGLLIKMAPKDLDFLKNQKDTNESNVLKIKRELEKNNKLD